MGIPSRSPSKPHYQSQSVRWERREEGSFKFVQSDQVARLWGDRKQDPRMTYEKLSRAMRGCAPPFEKRQVRKEQDSLSSRLTGDE
ncbi:hypothetical protein TNCV_4319041 [Trichonephila clavipes]|nr:hypothetical protein TNCV_4319041 [Trichonephila clavipes]